MPGNPARPVCSGRPGQVLPPARMSHPGGPAAPQWCGGSKQQHSLAMITSLTPLVRSKSILGTAAAKQMPWDPGSSSMHVLVYTVLVTCCVMSQQ